MRMLALDITQSFKSFKLGIDLKQSVDASNKCLLAEVYGAIHKLIFNYSYIMKQLTTTINAYFSFAHTVDVSFSWCCLDVRFTVLSSSTLALTILR